MRVQNCFFPKVIINPYTGSEITCRCGKCTACLNQRSFGWVQRLDMESAKHKYTLFATITYDDFNVPQIIRMRMDDYPAPAYIDSETGQVYELSEIHETFSEQDKKYVSDTKVLNVLSKSDFQKFIKRLRYYFNQYDKEARLSYYICGEYGPRTYRPHGHMLLFFDSDICLKNIEVLLSKAWTYGNIYDPHLVHGTASEYCAAYINGFSSLPKVYLHKQLKPFTLFSKSPSIGFGASSPEGLREQILAGNRTIRVFRKSTNKFEDVPLWRSFEARLYPRCLRFSSLSHADRVSLYREILRYFKKYEKVGRIAEEIEKRQPLKRECCVSDFQNYIWLITHKMVRKYHFVGRNIELPDNMKNLPFLPKDFQLQGDVEGVKTQQYEYCHDSLIRFLRISKRFLDNARLCDLSISEYDSLIEKYYEKRDLERLKDDYNYQSSYFAHNPKWHYIYFDKGFYDKVFNKDYGSFPPRLKFYLNDLFLGSVPLKDKLFDDDPVPKKVLNIPCLESLIDFQSMCAINIKIAKDLTKTKENNDYAKQRQDKFSNIINFQNL